jgi:hypothetical protein
MSIVCYAGIALVFLATFCSSPVRVYARGLAARREPRSVLGSMETDDVKYLNAAPGVGYVGSQVCQTCHETIYKQYIRTDMARSMSLPTQRPELEPLSPSVTFFDEKLGQYFEVLRHGDRFFRSEYAGAPNGRELFRHTEKLAYVLGTGENGICYVVQIDQWIVGIT